MRHHSQAVSPMRRLIGVAFRCNRQGSHRAAADSGWLSDRSGQGESGLQQNAAFFRVVASYLTLSSRRNDFKEVDTLASIPGRGARATIVSSLHTVNPYHRIARGPRRPPTSAGAAMPIRYHVAQNGTCISGQRRQ